MANSTKTAPGKPFEPGQSGNPNGRPVIPADVKAAAREYTQEALDTLRDLMRKGNPAIRARAAGMLLDRGWGKPVQPVNASINQRRFADLSRLTPEQLDAYEQHAAALAELEERAGPAEQPQTAVVPVTMPTDEEP